MTPFLTIVTPTYRRPTQLLACMASVQAQTIAGEIQHVIEADYVGIGVAGMFERLASRPPAVYGQYVTCLGDDDVLAAPDAVEQLKCLAAAADWPDVIVVSTEKGHHGRLPYEMSGPPIAGRIDWNCVVTRRDVWHAHVQDFTASYEADHRHAKAMWEAGRTFHYATDLLLSRGLVSGGRPE